MTGACPAPPTKEEEVELETGGAGSSITWLTGERARGVEEEEERERLSESG